VGGGRWLCISVSPYHYVDVLDLSSKSPCWKPFFDMLFKRNGLGVGEINNYNIRRNSYVKL